MSQNLAIAKTIRQQLVYGSVNTQKVWCWGANSWLAVKNGLAFKVSARRHKGFVQIILNGSDLYDVSLISNKGETKKKWNNLYFDQLTEVIDLEIEKTPSDKRF